MCFLGTDIDSLFFESLSLPICYLIFQSEVFLGVIATGSWGFGDLHEEQFVCCIEADVEMFE